MATGNSAPAAPSAHPHAKWQATRDISTLVAGNDTGLRPRFVVVSETDPLERLQFTPVSVRTLRTTIIKPSNQSDAIKIEDMVSKQEHETFYGNVFFLPVSAGSEFVETEDWGRNLQFNDLEIKITGVILYSADFDQRPRLLLSTTSY
jgi:hypothetical protein